MLLKGIGDGNMIFLRIAVIRAGSGKIVNAVVYVVAAATRSTSGRRSRTRLSSGSLLLSKKLRRAGCDSRHGCNFAEEATSSIVLHQFLLRDSCEMLLSAMHTNSN